MGLEIQARKWPDRFLLTSLDAKQHGAQLYSLFHGNGAESVWSYLRDGPFPSLDQYAEHIDTFQHRPDILPFVVEDVSRGILVGKLMVIKVTPDTEWVEIAYVAFSPAVHGTGAAIVAVGLLADHIFLTLGKAGCRWKCDKRNVRSLRFAEKMGFSLEREIVSDFQMKGALRDTLVFSQTKDAWPVNRLAILNSQTQCRLPDAFG